MTHLNKSIFHLCGQQCSQKCRNRGTEWPGPWLLLYLCKNILPATDGTRSVLVNYQGNQITCDTMLQQFNHMCANKIQDSQLISFSEEIKQRQKHACNHSQTNVKSLPLLSCMERDLVFRKRHVTLELCCNSIGAQTEALSNAINASKADPDTALVSRTEHKGRICGKHENQSEVVFFYRSQHMQSAYYFHFKVKC